MHEYSVELRVYGKKLVPAEVTKDLGLHPSFVRHVGDKASVGVHEMAIWGYNGFREVKHRKREGPLYKDGYYGYNGFTEVKHWKSLEKGLLFVMQKLRPLLPKIHQYKSRHAAIWWCGHFQTEFCGGPTLSPATLKLLAEFEVELFINNFISRDDGDRSSEMKGSRVAGVRVVKGKLADKRHRK